MVDPLTLDDVDENAGAKDNFIGRVVDNSVDGLAESADYEQSEQKWERDIDHFAYIEVLDGTYDKHQNIFSMDVRSGPMSKWTVMVMHLTDIHGNLREDCGIETAEGVLEFIRDRVYEWKDVTWQEDEEYPIYGEEHGITYADIGQENDPNSMLVPVREVTDEDELADLGQDVDTGDVEEVDL